MDYTVDVSNASGAGAESDAITATDTIPSGETPVNTGSGWSGGTGWSCSTAGKIVTCTDSGGLAAGAESSITIPWTSQPRGDRASQTRHRLLERCQPGLGQ